MLTDTREMLAKAQAGKYAVAHFNTKNLEFTQAILEAATELSSPVIIAASTKVLEHALVEDLAPMVRELARRAPVPVAFHLDHGPNIDWVVQALGHGFTSVMIDASAKPFEENIALTREVVEMCSGSGVPVEAELGQLKGVEDWVKAAQHVFTDPDSAAEFVERTGCSSLAVAIGTSHGAYKFKGASHLDFDRLKAIRERVSVPLVLHGASMVPTGLVQEFQSFGGKTGGDATGVSEEDIRTAIGLGICKVNSDTDLRLAFTVAARKHYQENPTDFDPISLLSKTRDAVKAMAKHHMQLFGSAGRA
jgi:fructose-bisphosphate aldolase class II